MSKSQLSSPFKNAFGTAVPERTTEPGAVIDHNVCEPFSEPRAKGHGGVDEVFFAGVGGSNYHLREEKGAATLSTTMGRKR